MMWVVILEMVQDTMNVFFLVDEDAVLGVVELDAKAVGDVASFTNLESVLTALIACVQNAVVVEVDMVSSRS
jgi:hypothetical protein